MRLPITPETTIGVLTGRRTRTWKPFSSIWRPHSAKLRNPVMRRTVAKVATLEQASKIGGVSLQGMILKLRAAAGLEAIDVPVVETPQPGEQRPSTPNGSRVVEEVDADVMLETRYDPSEVSGNWWPGSDPGSRLCCEAHSVRKSAD